MGCREAAIENWVTGGRFAELKIGLSHIRQIPGIIPRFL